MSDQWKMVPVEPTEEMMKAGIDWTLSEKNDQSVSIAVRECFTAMLSASPSPPVGGGSSEPFSPQEYESAFGIPPPDGIDAEPRKPDSPCATSAAAQSWQPIETAPKDGTHIWGWLSDSGIHLLRWGTAEEWAAKEGGEPDEYISCWVKVCDESDGDWNPRLWLPKDAVAIPPNVAIINKRWREVPRADHSLLADPMISTPQGVTGEAK